MDNNNNKITTTTFNKLIQVFKVTDGLKTGQISDGYHTFDELYHHRAVLTAALFNMIFEKGSLYPCWKSMKHADGTMYDGMFIVGVTTPFGNATYHYDIDPYWDMFHIPEIEFAPEFDGHTPEDAINRIAATFCDISIL